MTIRYRKYVKNDLSDLQQLMTQLGYRIETEDLIENIKAITTRDGQIFVAEENEKVVGSVCVIIDARLAEGIYAEIVSLIVNSNSRGQGIGKSLVKMAEEWAIGKVNKIRVRANEIRKDAHSFYESSGFKYVKNQKIFNKIV